MSPHLKITQCGGSHLQDKESGGEKWPDWLYENENLQQVKRSVDL